MIMEKIMIDIEEAEIIQALEYDSCVTKWLDKNEAKKARAAAFNKCNATKKEIYHLQKKIIKDYFNI
jgi:hypothetical protein